MSRLPEIDKNSTCKSSVAWYIMVAYKTRKKRRQKFVDDPGQKWKPDSCYTQISVRFFIVVKRVNKGSYE